MIVHRIGSRRYSANDGTGAALYGGRWNRKGTSLIYSAESRALCALEILAGNGGLAGDYVSVPIEIPDVVSRWIVAPNELPAGWDSPEHQDGTQEFGTAWAQRAETALLVVPSAVIPPERNYLLNPLHSDFSRIVFHAAEPFRFDERLSHRRSAAGM